MGGAHRLEGAVLEHAQELHLQGRAHVADLVEEDGAAVREAEAPFAVVDGVGEGAAHVPEQLRLEQLLGDRAAVDGDEHALGAAAAPVQGARDHLLARAALARDQDGAVGVRHALDHVEHAAQRRARADQVLVVVAPVELALEQAVLGLEAAVLDGLRREPAQHVVVGGLDRLLEEPVGAGPQRLERGLRAAVAGDHDAGQVGLHLADLAHQLEPADARHLDVAEHEIDRLVRDELHGLARVARRRDLMARAREDPLHRFAVQLVVIDHEHMRLAQRPVSPRTSAV